MMNDLPEAQDFALIDAEGKTIHLSDYRGVKHVILARAHGAVAPGLR
jgi:peroxiredoxin